MPCQRVNIHKLTTFAMVHVSIAVSVIVDTVAWNPGSLAGFVDALWDIQVFAVGIHCALPLLEERERQRGDRSPGLARRQSEVVHRNAHYDFEIE